MTETELARHVELERADAARSALLGVLAAIDGMSGNELYQKAWKKLAIKIQAMLR